MIIKLNLCHDAKGFINVICIFVVPNISPQNVVGVRTLETSMTILWNKLALVEARGYILNYTIVYYPLQSTTQLNSIILNKVVNSEFSSTTINGLDANSAYIVHISANTDAGSGLLSTPIIIQLYGNYTILFCG